MKYWWFLGIVALCGCAPTPEPPALEPCRVSMILDQQLPPALTLVMPEPTGNKLEDLRAYRLALGRRQQRAEQVRHLVGLTQGQHPEIKTAYYAFLNAEVEFVRAKRIQVDIEITAEEAKKPDPRVKLQAKRVGALETAARSAQVVYETARKKCQ